MLQDESNRCVAYFQEMFEKLSKTEFTQRIADSYAYARRKEPEISRCMEEYINATEPSSVYPLGQMTEGARIGKMVINTIGNLKEVTLASALHWAEYDKRERVRRIRVAKAELKSLGVDCNGKYVER